MSSRTTNVQEKTCDFFVLNGDNVQETAVLVASPAHPVYNKES